ncbi:Transcriptional regulatory protein devR (dosR) [Mobiluncus mulieris]|uniref:response regulator transcription factor n=1 Tax=Mobiluncus mulieris TaxID=2052 RepID=UPI00019F93CB|nr:response regulator transcription factor [Mobiluncus mulieris]EEJ54037.1 response regulator receiver domain protein [Mobiluncus mulieris ATCC 35243]SPX75729.1 Transcriptional regulatory protein devR (dosR) [Mobiluncus mulieris]
MGDQDCVIRVIFADDDAVYLRGMTDLLNRLKNIEIVGQASDGDEAMRLIETIDHDVVLLDVTMPSMGGIEVTKSALELNPDEKILMLTAFERPDMLRQSLAAGARGFLTKETDFREIGAAIQRVFRGGKILDEKPLSLVMDYFVSANPENGDQELKAKIEALPEHLRIIVNLIGEARSNKEIAKATGLSLHTVTTYIKRILKKLNIRRGQLTLEMIRLGMNNTASQQDSETGMN